MVPKVVFSQRAFLSLVCEVAEHLNTETGGLFLGYRYDDYWYIIETIDPGPAAILRPAYFEYEKKYVEHLLNKQARLYSPPPVVLGLWHRHPGSFDRFSSTDDQTNLDFTKQCGPVIVSALVNLDPAFRLTVFCTDNSLMYKTIEYEVESKPDDSIQKNYKDVIALINEGDKSRNHYVKGYEANKVLKALQTIEKSEKGSDVPQYEECNLMPVGTWIDEFLKEIENDINYLNSCGITVTISLVHDLKLRADLRPPESEDVAITVFFEKYKDDIVLSLGSCKREYTPGYIQNMACIEKRRT